MTIETNTFTAKTEAGFLTSLFYVLRDKFKKLSESHKEFDHDSFTGCI